MLGVPPHRFLRIHRSILINPRHISRISDSSVIIDRTELPLSRAQRKSVMNSLVMGLGEGE